MDPNLYVKLGVEFKHVRTPLVVASGTLCWTSMKDQMLFFLLSTHHS